MDTINETYVNALLADAAYVNLHDGNSNETPLLTGTRLTTVIAARMTQPQAEFITSNFNVVNQELSPTGGFDAVVWRGKPNTPYAGKVYVSMRGTQGLTDIADDVQLASTGVPKDQITSMVNWWLRMTTPSNAQAKQIAWDPLHADPSDPLQVAPSFVEAPTAASTGLLVGQSSIEAVNGHSLGGYLATVFTRLFGGPLGYNVQSVKTFNSAGFNNLQASNIDSSYNQIAQLIGSSLGLGSFSAVASKQTNTFGENGINVTTNSWADFNFTMPGFNQYGMRQGLYQEDGLGGNPINNHSMYKQTDLLALGAVLEKLDPGFTINKLNDLVKAGSNVMAASYEGVLDGLRRVFQGANVTPTSPLDDAAGSEGPQPQAREDFHTNLKDIADLFAEPNSALNSLAGKVRLTLADTTLAAKGKTDFAAFLSLNALSPVVLNVADEAAIAALMQVNQDLAVAWQADKNARLYGDTTKVFDYSDQWYADRAALLQTIVARNQQDNTTGFIYSAQAPAGEVTFFSYYDASNTAQLLGTTRQGVRGQPERHVVFGNDESNTLTGYDNALGDHLYGGAGDDKIYGEPGNDWLEGNRGNDTLVGGADKDTLLGGQGKDTYIFAKGDGFDTIRDGDGSGTVIVGEDMLKGGTIYEGDRSFRDADGHTYTKIEKDLLIDGTILVKDWKDRDLGLTMPTSAPAATKPKDGAVITGDPVIHTMLVPDDFVYTADMLIVPVSGYWPGYTQLVHPVPPAGQHYVDYFVTDVDRNPVETGGAAFDDSIVDWNRWYGAPRYGDREIYTKEGDDHVEAYFGLGNYYIDTGAGDDSVLLTLSKTELDALKFPQGIPYYDLHGVPFWPDVQTLYWTGDVHLGSRDDTVIVGTGSDVVASGAGNDLIYGDAQMSIDRAIAVGATQTGAVGTGDWLTAGDGNDTVIGGATNDLLAGGFGNDLLVAGAGDDVLLGDNDILLRNHAIQWRLDANPDEPTVYFQDRWFNEIGYGDDTIYAGAGNDYAAGGYGSDVIFGENGNDIIKGGSGNDVILGGDGDDAIYGDLPDAIGTTGRPGDDYLVGGAGNDTIKGNEGADTLVGGTGNDVLIGGAGQDTYVFNAGDGVDHIVDSSSDNNILRFGEGINRDNIKLALGSLAIDLGNGDAIHIDNFDPDNAADSSSIQRFEFADGSSLTISQLLARGFDIQGSAGADETIGTSSNDRLNGLEGDDTLVGGMGDDVLNGGAGNDYLSGGAGNDTYILGFGTGQDTVVDYGGVNTVQVLAGVVVADVTASRDGENNLVLALSSGTDSITFVDPGHQNQQLTFADGTVWDLNQLAAQLPVVGTSGDDSLGGGNSNETLNGLGGNDTLAGGPGSDTYIFGFGYGHDIVVDGGDANTVRLVEGVAPADVTISRDTHNNLVLTLTGGGDTLMLANWYAKPSYQTAQVTFSDGTVWDLPQLAAQLPVVGTDSGEELDAGYEDTVLDGRGGNDTLVGGARNDTYIFGFGSGRDTLTDAEGSNTVRMAAGVSASDVTLSRDSNGNVVLTLTGGADSLTLRSNVGIVECPVQAVTFADGTVWELPQMVPESLKLGTEGNDLLWGTTGRDILSGLGGNDTLSGSRGNDTYIFGFGCGQDQVLDNLDKNTVQMSTGVSASDVTLSRDANNNLVLTLTGGADALTLTNWYSNVSNETGQVVFADGTVWDLAAMAANIPVMGTAGADNLFGGNGQDTLNGLGGNDYLFGNGGNDTYVFGFGSGRDTVTDRFGGNTVQMSAGVSPADVTLSRDRNNNLIISLAGDEDVLTLSKW